MKNILSSTASRVLTVVLLLQAATFYGFSRGENAPQARRLLDFDFDSSNWTLVQNVEIEKEVLDVLKADDTTSRTYENKSTGVMANLFVAYFQTQRTGKAPHSPKNCLPGSGWVPSVSDTTNILIPGEAQPITVNRYIVAKGSNQSLVLYWYQAHNRVVASEYMAKVYTVTDALRMNRTDTSLVRVVIPVRNGDKDAANAAAVQFVQSFFEPLKNYLPA